MKKLLMSCVAVLVLCIAANAAPVTCYSNVISLTPGGTSPTLTCGGLTFSNFQVSNFSGENASRLDINSVSYDSATGEVVLAENPNLGSGGHLNLFYTVTGPLVGIDLTVLGTMATVIERACANPIPTLGALANSCTNVAQTTSASPIGAVTVHTEDMNQPISVAFPQVNTAYMYKDIGAATGGGLTAMNESFKSAVPEPVTMMLVGSALIGLALVRRRAASR
jgi:hypothetical protein